MWCVGDGDPKGHRTNDALHYLPTQRGQILRKQGPDGLTEMPPGAACARHRKAMKNGIEEILRSGRFPSLNTFDCRDHDDIPPDKRVLDLTDRRSAQTKEKAFGKHISDRRALVAEVGHGRDYRMSHSVPADLFHGKIRETGDKNYWDDPKNLNRHKSCKVD